MDEIKKELKKLCTLQITFGLFAIVNQLLQNGISENVLGILTSVIMGVMFCMALLFSIYKGNNMVRVLWGVFAFYATLVSMLGVLSSIFNIFAVLFFAITWRILTGSTLGDYTRKCERTL